MDVAGGEVDSETSEGRLQVPGVDESVPVLIQCVEHLSRLSILRKGTLVLQRQQQELAEVYLPISYGCEIRAIKGLLSMMIKIGMKSS